MVLQEELEITSPSRNVPNPLVQHQKTWHILKLSIREIVRLTQFPATLLPLVSLPPNSHKSPVSSWRKHGNATALSVSPIYKPS